MAIKWQYAALLLSLIVIGGGGLLTYTDLFGVLFSLSGVSYTHSGDIFCETNCESYINISTWYWNICFEHPPDDQAIYYSENPNDKLVRTTIGETNATLYKKSTRGRKLWVNLNNVDNIITTEPRVEVDWLVPARGKDNWRPVKDGDCWERGKINKIKLVGHKDVDQTVKWTFQTGDYVDIDPLWKPKKKELPLKQIINKEYKWNSERTVYNDYTENLILYNSPTFADRFGTKLEDAKSLKDCEYCDKIKLEISQDPLYIANIIDYNATSIMLELSLDGGELGHEQLRKNINLEVYDKDNKSNKDYDSFKRINTITDTRIQILPFGFDKEVKWGKNSTTVRINSSTADGSIATTGVGNTDWDTVHDSTSETANTGIANEAATVNCVGFNRFDIKRFVFYFNTTTLASDTILDASINVYSFGIGNDSDSQTYAYVGVVSGNRVSTPLVNGDFDLIGSAVNFPELLADKLNLSLVDINQYNVFTLNQSGLNQINQTGITRLGLRIGNDIEDVPISCSDGTNTFFIHSANAANKPFLNITLLTVPDSLNITNPTTESPLATSDGTKIEITYDFQLAGINQTTGVSLDNITIDNVICDISQNEECTGTLDCSSVSVENSCNNMTQCNWTAGSGAVDYTSQDCDAYWGFDCDNAPSADNDNTHDACPTYAGSDGDTNIQDVRINGTDFKLGDDVRINCTYKPFGSSDEEYIYIFNGSGTSTQLFSGNAPSGTAHTRTVVFTPLGLGEHWARCIIDDNGENDDCADGGTFFDNDDLNFSVGISIVDSCDDNSPAGSCFEAGLVQCDNHSDAGCSKINKTEEAFITGVGWQGNCTVGTGCTGSEDLNVTATQSGTTISGLETGAISCGAADSCDAGPLSADQQYECTDNCRLGTIDAGGFDVTFNGSGTWYGNITNYGNLLIPNNNDICLATVSTNGFVATS